jgi:hypothetical protein
MQRALMHNCRWRAGIYGKNQYALCYQVWYLCAAILVLAHYYGKKVARENYQSQLFRTVLSCCVYIKPSKVNSFFIGKG